MSNSNPLDKVPALKEAFEPLLIEYIAQELDVPPDPLFDPKAKEKEIRTLFYEQVGGNMSKLLHGMELFSKKFCE